MCNLTAFVITEDSDIDYVGGGKMEMIYQADNWYFEFLEQQVKELHMERSQGFITSVFRALMGSRCKTRRKQVMGITLMPVTIGSYTPVTSATTPTMKTLSEDMTQADVEARPLSPVPTNEEEVEGSSENNQLGDSYVADIQHRGINVPFHCTNVMMHEHFTNHFNECLNDKVYIHLKIFSVT